MTGVPELQPLGAVYGMKDKAGNFALYHLGETNRCPSCGWQQWLVGRQTAECSHCHAAVPLAHPEPAPPTNPKGT
jgi:hypothetical protein